MKPHPNINLLKKIYWIPPRIQLMGAFWKTRFPYWSSQPYGYFRYPLYIRLFGCHHKQLGTYTVFISTLTCNYTYRNPQIRRFPSATAFLVRLPSKQVGRRVVVGNNNSDRPSTSRHPRAVSTQYKTAVHTGNYISDKELNTEVHIEIINLKPLCVCCDCERVAR